MNKANFTFFHLKGIGKQGVRVASSLFFFLSLFFSINMSGQTVSCNGNLNISVDPATCDVVITPATVGTGGDVVLIEGLPEASMGAVDMTTGLGATNGTASVTIDAELVPAFLASGMVMDITYNLIAGTVDAPTNSCWGTFLMEDKAPPAVRPGVDVTIGCDDYDPAAYWTDNNLNPTKAGVTPGDEMIVECTDATVSYSERRVNDQCVADTIFRTWLVTDVKGNTAEIVDTLSLLPETLDMLTLPCDYDDIDKTPVYTVAGVAVTFMIEGKPELACDGAGTEWNKLENGYPSPYPSADGMIPGTGVPGGVGTCGTIHATYEDLKIDICDADCAQASPSFKILRQWTILDWCEGTVLEHNQVIKVLDTVPPMFNELPDVTISTDLWGCGATYQLPSDPNGDNCSTDISVSYGSSQGTITGSTLVIPSVAKTMADTAEVYVYYEDCCNNIATDTFQVVVRDMVPPVVVADHHTVVSLSQYNENGLAKVHVSTFDDGSHDGCGPIGFFARRMTTNCDGPISDGFDLDCEDGDCDDTEAVEDLWFDYLHFCCEDVQFDEDGNPIPVMVVFRVCDDSDMDGVVENNGDDYCNDAMVEVEVQDKLPPACAAPANITINCIDAVAYQDLINAGPLSEEQAAKADAAFGAANGAATCNVAVVQTLAGDNECGIGTVTRTVVVTNTANELSTTCTQTINITQNDDNILGCEDITFPAGSAEAVAGYDWCDTNPSNIGDPADDGEDFPAIVVNDCTGATITMPEIDIDNLCSEVGINLTVDTFDFAGGGCKKLLAHWEIIDQCQFEENFLYNNGGTFEINPFVAENGYFEIYVEYDLFDTVGPEITCGDGQIVGCGEDLVGPLTATATDDCTDPAFFGWSWKLDVGDDGTFDFEGTGSSVSPSDLAADLTTFPAGNHSITWIVSDGCGNISSLACPFGLEQVDEKAPTPYCYDGLSSAVMLMNGVTLWAADFDAGSFDACSDVTVTMIPESDTEGLSAADAYAASFNLVQNVQTGTMEYGWNFTCDYIPNGVAATIDVRIYATDAAGNYDYCTASFRIQDNLGACEDEAGALANIGGNIATENAKMVDEVEVEAMTLNPEFPKYTNTGTDGNYAFNQNPTLYNYEITASKEGGYTDGVSTLDLVIIQKHILNIDAITSPYKLIAADINNDASIKASDLLQLRKLILGLYNNDELPSNSSWRFVDADFQFVDAANPFPFDEIVNVDELAGDVMSEDMVAVKIGDVNNSIILSANGGAQVRSNSAVTFELDNASFAAGEIVELDFTSADFNEVFGYQFTLEFGNELTFAGFEAGALNVTEANFGLNRISEGVITTSFDDVKGATASADEVLFTVRFTANTNANVSDVVNVTSKYTVAEAYTGAGLKVNDVNVAFRNGDDLEVANTYALFQNEPNPFRGSTTISFNLPEAANASLKVYDVTGKVLYATSADYAKGVNNVRIDGLNVSGVLYYQLDSDDFTATKKMIVIE